MDRLNVFGEFIDITMLGIGNKLSTTTPIRNALRDTAHSQTVVHNY